MTKKQKSTFYKTTFILGLVAIYWEIILYRQTVIDVKILLGLILAVGVLTTKFVAKDFQELFGYSNKTTLYSWSFIQSAASYGFLFCTLFMALNFYLATNETSIRTYKIIERTSLSGRKYHRSERKPAFKIMYHGQLKELIFPHEYYSEMDYYSEIELKVRKGFFGFDLLLERKLK